jgi:serine/threonine protein phosphatase PrpC
MSARLRTEVAQLSIVAGARQENAGDVGLVERSSVIPGGTGKGNLYLLVQVTGEALGKEEIHQELIEILSEEYLHVPGGVTNGLRRAIRAANAYLHERNLEALPLWHRTGETCCAVLRGNDLYMGIAGDAVIYVLRKGRVYLFPPPLTEHLSASPPEDQPIFPPLGQERTLPHVGLFHSRIKEYDIILLASSGLAQVATHQELIMAAHGGLQDLADALTSLAAHADISALLIRVQAAAREAAAKKEALPQRAKRLAPSPKTTPIERTTAPASKTPSKGRSPRARGQTLALGAAIMAFFAALGRGIRSFISWLFSSGILGTIGKGVRAGLISLLQGLGTLTKRMLPEPQAVPKPLETAYVARGTTVSTKERGSRLPLLGVFAIICIIGVVAAGLVIRTQQREAFFLRVLDEARAEFDSALTSDSRAAASQHLTKAEELVEEALLMKPADPQPMALQDQIFLEFDRVNQVVRLPLLAQVPFAAPEHQPYRIVAHFSDVYLLDEKTQHLQGYLLDEQGGLHEPPGGAVLLGPDSQFGEVAVQELNDLIWMEAGNGRETSNLLILVNGKSLLQFDALRGFTPVSVAGSELWADPRLIGSYFGYLYLLDAEEDRILKYTPTGNSYDSAPTDYLLSETPVELASAVDMAIDGFIYVLLADGQILKFSGGLPEDFSITGLDDRGLQNPVAIFASPETDHFYVADAGNERIVQLTKEGAFVRQFRPPRESADAFQHLRDMCVDEERGELLVLTSEALFLTPMTESQPVEE